MSSIQPHPGSSVDLDHRSQGVALSPDGSRVAVIENFGAGIGIFATDGNRLRRLDRSGTTAEPSLAFTDADHLLVPAGDDAGNDAMFQLWPVAGQGGARVIAGLSPGQGPLFNRAKLFDLSADGGTVVVLADRRDDDRVAIVDARQWTARAVMLRPALGRFDRIASVAISPDGARLAIGTVTGRLLLTDTRNGDLARAITVYAPSPSIGVSAVAFSPDGKLVATGRTPAFSSDAATQPDDAPEGPACLKIWDAETGHPVRVVGADEPVRQLAWCFDGSILAAVLGGDTLRLVPDRNGALVDRTISDLQSVQFARSSPTLAAVGGATAHIFTFH